MAATAANTEENTEEHLQLESMPVQEEFHTSEERAEEHLQKDPVNSNMVTDKQLSGNEKSEQRKKLESWLNKLMRIKISDGRTLIGSFLCTDNDMNVILGSCQEYVGSPGSDKEEPRILGLAMVPGRHIKSIEIDMSRPTKYGEYV